MADKTLSKDEVAALLAGVAESITGKEQRNAHDTRIVLVQYGKDELITHVSVHLFDYAGWSSASEYCDKINNLVFAGGEWIRANIVRENEIEKLEKPEKIETLLDLEDKAIQFIIRNINKQTLAVALKSIDNNILEKIKKNMTKRAVKMLEEDIKYMGPMRLSDVVDAQKKILNVMRCLEETSGVSIRKAKEDEIK
jgi:hypothetical protein